MSSYHNDSIERLFTTIANIRTAEECRAFFEDLCTIKEIQDMTQRLDTAVLLDKGMRYQEIAETVGVSTATISRVNRSLLYGQGGYRAVLNTMKESE